MNILVICGMKHKQLNAKIAPIASLQEVKTIYMVRRRKYTHPKVVCYSPPLPFSSHILLSEPYRIILITYILLVKKVDVVMGIFIRMSGIMAGIMGRLFFKPVIQNLVGQDLYICRKSGL